MQREIKFRAWSKRRNEMICLDLRDKHLGGNTGIWEIELPNLEIMQYTGLKDSTGREIYEGDIVKLKRTVRSTESVHADHYYQKEIIGKVVFKNGCFVVGEEGWYFWDYAQGGTDATVEILGNAFEHPELLNNK